MSTKSFWSQYCIGSGRNQPGNPTAANEMPAKNMPSQHMKMSPAKAKKILHDKSVRGHPLTPKQRGLFGAIADKDGD